MDFVIGGLAAMGAGVFTNPLEVVKIRMQLQGELQARGQHAVHYKNFVHAFYTIGKNDGILALQSGLVPATLVQFFLNGVRLGSYQVFQSMGLLSDANGNTIVYKSVVYGAFGAVLGAVASSPFFLVKTHLQSRSTSQSIAVGYQHKHEGMVSALRSIYGTHGVKGLWRGCSSTMPRAAVGGSAQVTSFQMSKEWLDKYHIAEDRPLLKTFMSAVVGGVVMSICMTPFDLIATRLYNQGVDQHGKGLLYKNYIDCVFKVWKTEGFLGFYKGLGPSYVRLGPHTVLCLSFWDQLKYVQSVVFPQ